MTEIIRITKDVNIYGFELYKANNSFIEVDLKDKNNESVYVCMVDEMGRKSSTELNIGYIGGKKKEFAELLKKKLK